jgi:hypothetical protein
MLADEVGVVVARMPLGGDEQFAEGVRPLGSCRWARTSTSRRRRSEAGTSGSGEPELGEREMPSYRWARSILFANHTRILSVTVGCSYCVTSTLATARWRRPDSSQALS